MRFALFCILSVMCNIAILTAKPILNKSKYLIATQYDNQTGVLCTGNATYQLAYNATRTEEDALASDYWIISNVSGDYYSFKNAETGQYIRYNSSASTERAALEMVSTLQSDNSTLFSLELHTSGGTCYYAVRSAVNPAKLWDRRTSLYSSVYPVGVYSGSGSSNELFVFYDSGGNAVMDETPVVLPKATKSLAGFSTYFNSLTFNGKTPVADASAGTFYLSMPDSLMGTSQNMIIGYSPKIATYTLYINGTAVAANSGYTFTSTGATQQYNLVIKSGTSILASATLYFSGLPLVQIFSDATIGSVNQLCRMAVTEPLKPDSAEVFLTNVKIHGSWSAQFNKKGYAINIRDSIGLLSSDRSFFGLRNDNNWVLDAMYIDPARMRNRVSTDLWNDFSVKPYWAPKELSMRNGTRGRFVELFMNNTYVGLYHMFEKVDRKQLNLKKLKYSADSTIITQRGELYKGTAWNIATLFGYGPYNNYGGIPGYSNTSETWGGFECKYPELDEGQPIDWKPLYDAVYLSSYLTSDATFKAGVDATFDLPVLADYYLLMELLLATDNHGKNMIFSVYDQSVSKMLSFTPWDMDATWGTRWDMTKNLTYAAQDYDTFVKNNEHGQVNLFLRLKSLDYNGWYSTTLKNRYRELRGSYFDYNRLVARFQQYNDLFTRSGAAVREQSKWGISAISTEMTYLSTWIKARLDYLDKYYLGAPYTDVKNIASASPIRYSLDAAHQLKFRGLQVGTVVSLYSSQGFLLQQCTVKDDCTSMDLSPYPSGIYLIRSGMYSTKIIR